MSFEEVKQKVQKALNKLRESDAFLIQANINERTISHKLAEYLQLEFHPLKVDCEYNRRAEAIKRLEVPRDNINWDDTEARTVFPDIVVHERGNDNNNLLVIEVKKSSNKNNQFDKNKLKSFTNEPYRYSFGLLLSVSMSRLHDELEWYSNGRAINE